MKPTAEQLEAVAEAMSCGHWRESDPCPHCLADARAAWDIIAPMVLEEIQVIVHERGDWAWHATPYVLTDKVNRDWVDGYSCACNAICGLLGESK